MHKSISRVIACVMLLAGIGFVLFALHHPQLSWPWGNTVSYFLYLVFDEEGYCLSSQQGVWDNEQKICRKDCIKWSQEQGCITEKMLEGDTE